MNGHRHWFGPDGPAVNCPAIGFHGFIERRRHSWDVPGLAIGGLVPASPNYRCPRPPATRLLPVNSDTLAPVTHQVTLGIRESHSTEDIAMCKVAALADLHLRRLRAGRLSQMGPPVGLKPREGRVTVAVNLPRQAVSLPVIDW